MTMCAIYGNILMVEEYFKTVSPIFAFDKARRVGATTGCLYIVLLKCIINMEDCVDENKGCYSRIAEISEFISK